MQSRMIAVSVGIACVAWFPSLPTPMFVLVALPVVIAWVYVSGGFLTLMGVAALGMLWGVTFGYGVIASIVPTAFEGQPVWVTGTVVGLPETKQFYGDASNIGQRFDLRVNTRLCVEQQVVDKSSIDQQRTAVPCYQGVRTLRLTWPGQSRLEPGQRWRLQVRLKRPHTLLNPGGFDYQTWLIQHKIGGVGYVREHPQNVYLGNVRWSIDRWRFNVAKALEQTLAERRYRAIYKALLLGDKRGISAEQWRLFSRTGTTHLMVISGLHIGLISALIFFLARTLALLVCRRVSGECIAAVMAIAGAIIYSAAAGFSLPTQRALIMISVWMLAIICRREITPSQGVVTALCFCVVFDPLAVVSRSFWLSFVAVSVILYASTGCCRAATPASQWLAMLGKIQWRLHFVIFIGLLPVLLMVAGQVSLLSPLANLVVVPLFSVLVVPGCLLAAFAGYLLPPMAAVWLLLDMLLQPVFSFLHFVNQHSDAFMATAAMLEDKHKLFFYCAAAMGVLLLLAPKGVPLRHWGWLLLLPIILFKPKPLPPATVEVTVLDVGQGLAIVVRTQAHVLVYDVGAAIGDQFNIAHRVLIPFLRSQGISTINKLVLSHSDNDHAGGWRSVTDQLFTQQVNYGQWLHGLGKQQAYPCRAGERWQWDSVHFEYLHPTAASDPAQSSGNNLSCVLKIATPDVSFLLTGDIEREIEYRLTNQYRHTLRSDVLLAPHHGSVTSSSWPFIKAIKPSHVVISSGYRNHFGHPHDTVLARYTTLGMVIHNTSEHGAIRFRVSNEQLLTVYHYRDGFQHYWL